MKPNALLPSIVETLAVQISRNILRTSPM